MELPDLVFQVQVAKVRLEIKILTIKFCKIKNIFNKFNLNNEPGILFDKFIGVTSAGIFSTILSVAVVELISTLFKFVDGAPSLLMYRRVNEPHNTGEYNDILLDEFILNIVLPTRCVMHIDRLNIF